jgi:hypothetical protein
MMRGASNNRKDEMAAQTQGTTTAVLHGLDCGFNRGKGKLLTKYMKDLYKKETKTKDMTDVEQQLFSLFAPRK